MGKYISRKSLNILATAASLATVTGENAFANVKLPAFFGDGMVVQRNRHVPIWGTAAAGETVTVSVAGQSVQSTADAAGKWKVELAPLPVGAPLEVTVAGKDTFTLRDVLVGEVWLASGQSNMAMRVREAANGAAESAAANYSLVRMFTVKNNTAHQPLTDVSGKWITTTPETVGAFSAAAYYFARELHQTLGVPIGIIHSSWGNTPAEAWTSEKTLRADDYYKPVFERWRKVEADYPQVKREYDAQMVKWEDNAAAAKAAGKPEPRRPEAPKDPAIGQQRPAALYNAMIAPLIPYSIRGVIWYQGESNADHAYEYRRLFPDMIRNWRTDWEQELPFLFVQLANYRARAVTPSDAKWAEVREAQTMTLSLPHTGMAVAIDIGQANAIHPANKQAVGQRLALAALAKVYGQNTPYSGPEYDSMTVEGNSIRLKFKHTDGGLVAKDGMAQVFAIAGDDKNWVWANAHIEGDTVVVSNPAVARPVAVRYAWADNPAASLYNGAGLPASPFRTDNWTGITEGAP
jgi:sialate O-acetylesterase